MKHKFGIYFCFHLIIVLFMWSSPFWLSWKVIFLLIFLYYIQLLFYGDCILIIAQYKNKRREITIYTQILENFNFKINRKRLVFISDYVFPWVILGIAFFWQVILK